jgi:hypothetical protein
MEGRAMTKKTIAAIGCLILSQLLVAVYLPINNMVEYWASDPISFSLHFYISVFSAIVFYGLFGVPFWKALSPTGRKFSIIAGIGWLIDLYLICTDPYLNGVNSCEPYVIGAMLIVGPCLVLLCDFLICRVKAGGKK